MDDSD